MKALMFGWEFPPHISGGLGTASYGLTKGLAKSGVEILFVMPKASGDEDSSIGRIINASDVVSKTDVFLENYWTNVKFLSISSSLIPYLGFEDYEQLREESLHKNVSASHLGEKYTFSGKYGANLMEEVARYAMVAATIARENEFDIIHAHDWLTYLAGIVAKRISGKPLVIHVHATEFDRSGESVNQAVYDLEKLGMEEADAIMAVSNLTRNIVISKYNIPESKVFTVHNAVDFSETQANRLNRGVDEKIVTFLGRITFQKGPEYFVEAADKVSKRLPNVRFVMAGSGDLMNRMVKRVAKLSLGSRFHFTGFLKGDDVNKMYSYSDVYVMPSVSEPFGISPLEAMRSGVPVIISKQSGVSEILKHALKVNFWDVNALADAIYALLTYKGLNNMIIRSGLDEVNSFSWDGTAQLVKRIYANTLEKRRL
ncbi:MAG: glycosyltransferase family 4 protein [Prevotellaceae bacterium]|jgi:glycosyltransferase involved in cell wall biosynthesis|nr:glycosyltransferase family 4 protein [Prevotellaceae bacterium]